MDGSSRCMALYHPRSFVELCTWQMFQSARKGRKSAVIPESCYAREATTLLGSQSSTNNSKFARARCWQVFRKVKGRCRKFLVCETTDRYGRLSEKGKRANCSNNDQTVIHRPARWRCFDKRDTYIDLLYVYTRARGNSWQHLLGKRLDEKVWWLAILEECLDLALAPAAFYGAMVIMHGVTADEEEGCTLVMTSRRLMEWPATDLLAILSRLTAGVGLNLGEI